MALDERIIMIMISFPIPFQSKIKGGSSSFFLTNTLQPFKMAMSGVNVSDDIVAKFNEMKLKHTISCLMLKIDVDKTKEIVIEKEWRKGELTFDALITELPRNEPRYIYYDYDYVKTEDQEGSQQLTTKNSKIVFIHWSPDSTSIKPKMLYASSKDAIKKAVQGVQVEIQANDLDELTSSEIESKLLKKV